MFSNTGSFKKSVKICHINPLLIYNCHWLPGKHQLSWTIQGELWIVLSGWLRLKEIF